MKESTISIFFISVIIGLVFRVVDIAYGAPEFDFDKASKAAALLETQIELTISLKKLNDFGFFYNMCVIYTRHTDGEQWFEYHRTEQHSGTNSPAFAEKVLIPYSFHEERKLQFRIYSDGKKNVGDLSTHIFRGYAICNFGELIRSKKMELPLSVDNGRRKDIGVIVIYAEKLVNNNAVLSLQLIGKDLKLYQWFMFKQPHFEIFKLVENEEVERTEEKKLGQTLPTKEYSLVYRSEIEPCTGALNPKWLNFEIPINSLCNANFQRELKVVCWNKQYIVGEFETSLGEMQKQKSKFTVVKDTGTVKHFAGEVLIRNFELRPSYRFSEFLAAGFKIRCHIAIDFSSGHPTAESFARYKYEEAIHLAVTALKDYIWNNEFATYGFGARFKDGIVSNNICLDSRAVGVEGVLRAYRESLPNITLGAEANLGPMIKMIEEKAREPRSSTQYWVLLAIMHGEISESLKSSFIDSLKGIARSPIAVIILSMNDFHLSKMKDLYYENVYNSKLSRDSVQFVSFNQFTDTKNAEGYFGTELLAKLPRQVVKFTSNIGLQPGQY